MENWRDAVWRAVAHGAEPERFAVRRDFLLAHVCAGDSVLDLGCGDGAFAAVLAGAGAQVTAADVADEALRRAAERAPGVSTARLEEGAPLPFSEDAFDLVWAGETLEHVADVTGLLSEVRRVLRWGGTLLVTTPNQARVAVAVDALRGRALERRFDPRSDHLRFFTARSLEAMIREAGFADVRVKALDGPFIARRALEAVAR